MKGWQHRNLEKRERGRWDGRLMDWMERKVDGRTGDEKMD
jgi:hypothetical protein